jgi:hypothetical protein
MLILKETLPLLKHGGRLPIGESIPSLKHGGKAALSCCFLEAEEVFVEESKAFLFILNYYMIFFLLFLKFLYYL